MIYDLGAHGGGVGRNSTKAHHEVRAHKNTKVGGRDVGTHLGAGVHLRLVPPKAIFEAV